MHYSYSVLVRLDVPVRGPRRVQTCRGKAVAALHPQVMAQCLRLTLPQRSGSSQPRSKIEELRPCEGKVEGGREQTPHVCKVPAGIAHVYRYVCR